MSRRPCRLCYGTRSRFVVVDEPPTPDGPFFVLTLCPCVALGVPNE
jgi:hypothetical protein